MILCPFPHMLAVDLAPPIKLVAGNFSSVTALPSGRVFLDDRRSMFEYRNSKLEMLAGFDARYVFVGEGADGNLIRSTLFDCQQDDFRNKPQVVYAKLPTVGPVIVRGKWSLVYIARWLVLSNGSPYKFLPNFSSQTNEHAVIDASDGTVLIISSERAPQAWLLRKNDGYTKHLPMKILPPPGYERLDFMWYPVMYKHEFFSVCNMIGPGGTWTFGLVRVMFQKSISKAEIVIRKLLDVPDLMAPAPQDWITAGPGGLYFIDPEGGLSMIKHGPA